jgi:hypothetical protein
MNFNLQLQIDLASRLELDRRTVDYFLCGRHDGSRFPDHAYAEGVACQ